ncbi:MAG: hypothetical protein HOW73_17165 [Polyangiaceae bacterium]|nr:hypothetical protein [Polyangiaceae bacterium]
MSSGVPCLRDGVEIIRSDDGGRRIYAIVLGAPFEFIVRRRAVVEVYTYPDADADVAPGQYGLNWGRAEHLGMLSMDEITALDGHLAKLVEAAS